MRFVVILFVLISTSVLSQGDLLAKEYFKNAEFEKALIEYKKLYAKSPANINYINQLIGVYHELEQYDEAEVFLIKLMARVKYPAFLVELGYNYQLKQDVENANINYDKAIASIDDRASNVFSVARAFQNHSLLDRALSAYDKAMRINPEYNFNLQLAQIYGEQGNVEKMFASYIDYIDFDPASIIDVKRAVNDFISEDGTNENNILFRKSLLKKMQQSPNVVWNELLSWLFIQQKDFKKAFAQEKAIYKREQASLDRVLELGLITVRTEEYDMAKDIFEYIIEAAPNSEIKLKAHYNLIQLEIKESFKSDYASIKKKYVELLNTYGVQSETLEIQIAYAHFLAFYMGEYKQATSFLEKALKQPISTMDKAKIKLELGDILVLQEKFNSALIYYTQIQRNLKNSTISQEARFRVAKASYYKGDFQWAESQLKILKSSTSQLIANDALDLKLLISDNKYEDSLQTALKLYAKADLLAFQNKPEISIAVLDQILEEHKAEPIMAQALYKQAELYELKGAYDKAKANYERMIADYRDGILVDDAYYKLAKIYDYKLDQPQKAKELYELIIFNHADSIYFVEARKRFRALRGDAIN